MNTTSESKTTIETSSSVYKRLTDFLFSPHPSVTDIAGRRRAQLSIILSFVLTCTNGLSLFFVGRDGIDATFYIQVSLTLITFIAYFVSRFPRFIWGGVILIASLSLSGFANVMSGSNDPASALYSTIPVALAIGSALLPVWGNVAQYIASLIGIMTLPLIYQPYTFGQAGDNLSLIFTIGLLLIVVQIFRNNIERERMAEVQVVNKELRELGQNLEQRVSERTKALSAVAEVSTAASTILETNRLLQQVVDLAKERFGLYHAHIYLLDGLGTSLVLSSGAGAIGQQMVMEGRSILLDREQSLVARAAREKKGVTVNDVTTEPGFLPNPLLPDTRSEMAVPMMVGDEVIGVFDVQSEVAGHFTDADIAVQTTLASQVAAAVRNARSYTEIQRSQALLSEALSISRLANWEYDFDKDLFTFNDNFYSIFRTTVEKAGGYKISSADYARFFVHPDDAALVGSEIQRVVESKERHFKTDLEHRIIFEGGEVGYISVKINVDRDENGKIIRWYGANQDVTERRRLEEINRKNAAQQEAINLITQRIQSATTIEEAMQVAARELGHALGKRQTLVSLEPSVLVGEHKRNMGS